MRNKLRVGIIVDDAAQSFLTYSLYQNSLKSVNYSIECLVIQKTSQSTSNSVLIKILSFIKRRGLKIFFDRIFFILIEKIERLIVTRSVKYKKVFAKHCLTKFHVKKIYVNPIISKSGLVYRYPEKDIESIKKENLDVLVRCGSGILRGDILNVCRLGILSFHHADNNVNRGGPPGFWEVFNRESSTGFIIQRLCSELDAGEVIFKGSIGTALFYQLNLCRLFIKSSVFLPLVLEKLAINQFAFEVFPKVPYSYPLYTKPTSYQVFQYLFKTFSHVVGKVTKKIMHKSYRWGVAYQFVDDWKDAVLWKCNAIKNPPHRFLADPFVVTQNSQTVIFVEDFDYRTSHGKISAWELKENGYREIGVALKEDFHLSYPFLIRTENNLFMVPDTHENKDIRLYKCVDFPLKWELSEILIDSIDSADSSVFFFDNKWWIFTNKDSSELGDHCSELHIFFSDNLESGDWFSHPNNPVIFDSTCARNGGLIFSDDGIYRVFQKQGFNIYGEAMGFSKIIVLTTFSYKEEVLFEIPAKFMKNIMGTHTFSFDSGVLCLDFLRTEDNRK